MKAPLLRRLCAATAGLASAALLFVATEAPADAAGTANNFGQKGELIISADRLLPLLNYTSSSTTHTQNGQDLTTSRNGVGTSLLVGRGLSIAEDGAVPVNVHAIPRIAADYTIIDHLTLGAGLPLGFGLSGTEKREVQQGAGKTTQSFDAAKVTVFGFVPRVGWILPLTEVLAFWPRGGFGIYSVSAHSDIVNQQNNTVTGSQSVTDTLFSLDLDPQLAIVPLEHFFFLLGPMINIPLSGGRSTKQTSGATTTTVSDDATVFNVGIEGSIGGWFDL